MLIPFAKSGMNPWQCREYVMVNARSDEERAQPLVSMMTILISILENKAAQSSL